MTTIATSSVQSNALLADPRQRENLWNDLFVQIYTNIFYQQTRRRIFERRENVVKVISLVLASGTFLNLKNHFFTDIIQNTPSLAFLCGAPQGESISFGLSAILLAIVVANSWSLVFRWNTKALDAAKRYESWSNFEATVKRTGMPLYTEEQYYQWQADAATLEVGEAAPNRYLVFTAEQDARRVLLHDADYGDSSKIEQAQRALQRAYFSFPRFFVALN